MTLLRRDFIAMLGGLAAMPAQAAPDSSASPADPPQARSPSAYDFSFAKPDGGRFQLSDYRGRPILIVNTATSLRLCQPVRHARTALAALFRRAG